jgi:hypothetical protein
MKNVRGTTKILADKLFVRPWAPTQEQAAEHEKKKLEEGYSETPECKSIEAALFARAKVIEAFQAQGSESEVFKRKIAMDALPESAKAELAELGVELPTDIVELHLDLGDLLMCAYYSQVVLPTAPIAKARMQMRVQRLAADSQKDEFTMDNEAMACIDAVMSDDKLWENMQVETYVMVNDKKSIRICNTQVVSMFPEVVQSLIEVFAK